jgi:molybdenum cofactor biosynthesis enzyme MoaA
MMNSKIPKLEEIGFYTLTDDRAKSASIKSPLSRCELILTSRCNFRCPYCRSVGGNDIPMEQAAYTVNLWCDDGLKNIRFSGGEPTLYNGINELVRLSQARGVKRIALSTNGSASLDKYKSLLDDGVNDFSISLDACCAEDGDKMAGGRKGAFDTVVKNIKWLAKATYVTVGVVLTETNVRRTEEIIVFADSLGVSDIRVIPAAQHGATLPQIKIKEDILKKYPILRYRENNLNNGRQVRGNPEKRCGLVLDDMAVMGDEHFPCIIYIREGGKAIGKVSSKMRKEREAWSIEHDCAKDEICSKNCLDVCVDYNRKWLEVGAM